MEDGTAVKDVKSIVKNYLAGWLILDIIACFPFSLMDYFMGNTDDEERPGKYNSLLRLLRLPRLYKLLRVARIMKAFRHYKNSEIIERIQDLLNINSRIFKLLKFVASVGICVHLMGCLWFFSARLENFDVNTWVVRYSYLDEDKPTQYLASIYWAFTTVTTVGYGDISAGTDLEMVLAIFWMVVGAGFYSYTVGSLSSFLSAIDTRESVLASKLAAVYEFAKETGISNSCRHKIRQAIKYNNYKLGTVWSDKHQLFEEIPKKLRYQVAMSMYNGLAKTMPFFQDKDPALIVFLMPLLRPLHLGDSEYLYNIDDFPDEVYFIIRGRVNLIFWYMELVYKSYLKGSYIGDIEIVLDCHRLDDAQAFGECEFLTLSKSVRFYVGFQDDG